MNLGVDISREFNYYKLLHSLPVTEAKKLIEFHRNVRLFNLSQQTMTEYSDESTGVQREWSCLLPDRNYLQ